MFRPYQGRDAEREEAMERLRMLVGRGEVPDSAIKVLRQDLGMSQRGLARTSGVSQTLISRIESGDTPLTGKAAGKLAVALKSDRHGLAVAENLSQMGRLVVKGKLSRKKAAEVAMHLIENEPHSKAGRRLTDAALEELVKMTEATAETQRVAALKSRNRDRYGRQIGDPLGLKKRRDENSEHGPTRDTQGRRVKKPFDAKGRPVHGRKSGR